MMHFRCARAVASLALATACLPATARAVPPATSAYPISHVIIIMQENRSFDNYFGTYPGANGFPAGTCVPLNPASPNGGCVVPFHDLHDVNTGGPHQYLAATADLDDGITSTKMDGFVYQQTTGGGASCSSAKRPSAAPCGVVVNQGVINHDVMGYHTQQEIPNYWQYARHFVLQDAMFESVRSWSLDAHLEMAGEWTAKCTDPKVLSSCNTSLTVAQPTSGTVAYPWVNLYQLMDLKGVSWKYYLGNGAEPDCDDGEMTCEPQAQRPGILSIWNTAPGFAWVQAQGAAYLTAHNPGTDQFLVDVKNGTLPQVSWIIPSWTLSEHPPSGVTAGMEYVTSLVNAVMQSPYWRNTAIYIAWDDWGGFYDHVAPPVVDYTAPPITQVEGFGLRVPGLMISAYARAAMIDHAVYSFDSYATLIEDLFMGRARLDPNALGQPDNRPDIRDEITTVTFPNGATAPVGNLLREFDFTRTLPALVLSTHIPTSISVHCGSTTTANPQDCVNTKVLISWQAVASGEVPGPFTYRVLRDAGKTPVCMTTGNSCIDEAPGQGTHYYTVYSVSAAKEFSPQSAAAEADVP